MRALVSLPVLQQIPEGALTLPGVLSTLVVLAVVFLVGRFLLKVALRIVILAAIVAGVLWFLGGLSALPV